MVFAFRSFRGCLGRASHKLWLRFPVRIGSQPTLPPESSRRFRSSRAPY